MKTENRTPREYAMANAVSCAERDFALGRDCDSARYFARENSAWAKWYKDGYKAAQVAKEQRDKSPGDPNR